MPVLLGRGLMPGMYSPSTRSLYFLYPSLCAHNGSVGRCGECPCVDPCVGALLANKCASVRAWERHVRARLRRAGSSARRRTTPDRHRPSPVATAHQRCLAPTGSDWAAASRAAVTVERGPPRRWDRRRRRGPEQLTPSSTVAPIRVGAFLCVR